MSRRRAPSFQAIDPQLVSSGLMPDRHSLLKALWESADNVTFWNGSVRRKIPPAQAFDTGEGTPIRGLGQQITTDGSRWLWAGTHDRIYKWRFGAPTLVGAVGTWVLDQTATQRPTIYDFTPYGDWMIVNGGYPGEAARIDKPGSPFTEFASGIAPVGVTRFMKLLSFIVAVGYGARGTTVGASDANNIEDWDFTSTTNTATEISIDEFNTPIRAAAKLADAISVFSEDQMALVRYIGAPFILGQKTMLDGIGAVGKAAVASDTKVNVGMSRAGAWWTDGASVRYIDEGYISTYFQENVNWAQAAKIVVARNDFTGCFEFHLPVRGSNSINEAWSWDSRTGGWSPCQPFSFFDERRLFEHVLYGSNDGNVLLGDFNAAGAGALELTTKPLVMATAESPHIATRVDELDFLLHEASGIEWRLGCSDEPEGDYVWTAWTEAVKGARINEVPSADDGALLPEQPYWRLSFRSQPGVDDWKFDLQGFLMYGISVGTKA